MDGSNVGLSPRFENDLEPMNLQDHCLCDVDLVLDPTVEVTSKGSINTSKTLAPLPALALVVT